MHTTNTTKTQLFLTQDLHVTPKILFKGSNSFILKGYHLSAPDQPLAVKLVSDKNFSTSGILIQEYNILKRLNENQHKNILKTFGSSETNVIPKSLIPHEKNLVYGVSEWADMDFFDFLDKISAKLATAPMADVEKIARTFFRQMVDANLFIQSQGYIHRDLKLENFLINLKDYRIILSDFGFSAKFTESKTQKSDMDLEYDADVKVKYFTDFKGTDGYIAPEILLSLPYDGRSSDVFALGVILFTMVFRSRPFAEPKKSNALYNLLSEGKLEQYIKARKFKAIPSFEFFMLIEQMIRFDPKQRITLLEIQSHPWYTKDIYTVEELRKILE